MGGDKTSLPVREPKLRHERQAECGDEKTAVKSAAVTMNGGNRRPEAARCGRMRGLFYATRHARRRQPAIWIGLEMTGLKPEPDRSSSSRWLSPTVISRPSPKRRCGPCIRTTPRRGDGFAEQEHAQPIGSDRPRESVDVRRSLLEAAAFAFLGDHVAGRHRRLRELNLPGPAFPGAWMPELEDYFHYRNLDVSTLKELARRWKPDLMKGIPKEGKHEALADVYESIAEMKYYRETFIRP